MISVQTADFDVGREYQALRDNSQNEGAIVFFTGLVRDFSDALEVKSLHLEHYPGMTEKVLEQVVVEAKQRWPLDQVRVIHRVGTLQAKDQIVFVATSSKHREAAFNGCQFIMDILKTQAPFWKKEIGEKGGRWVDAKQSDEQQAGQWIEPPPNT